MDVGWTGSILNSSQCTLIWQHWFLQQYLGCSRYLFVLRGLVHSTWECHYGMWCVLPHIWISYLSSSYKDLVLLYIVAYISNKLFSESQHLVSYVSHQYAIAYDRLNINIPGTENTTWLEAAIPLAIEVTAQPNDANEPFPHTAMVAWDKLLAGISLSEIKVILGWLFNFRKDTHCFPPKSQVYHMDSSNSENDHAKAHNLKRSWHNHWINGTCGICDTLCLPFSQWLCSFHYCSTNQCFTTMNDTCMRDLELMKEMLAKAHKGINMNLLALWDPVCRSYSDSCPAGLQGYSD